MTDSKWFVLSKTIFGSLLAIAAGVWNLSEDQTTQIDGLIQGALTLAGGVIALYGRFTTKGSGVTVLPK
ncbi:MAG: hypothetical protein AB7E70_20890 [Hyphomicrobiaceae bacterium]